MTDPFKLYIQTLQADLARGNASEHTHRPDLKALLESLGERLTATNDPKRVTDCGNELPIAASLTWWWAWGVNWFPSTLWNPLYWKTSLLGSRFPGSKLRKRGPQNRFLTMRAKVAA